MKSSEQKQEKILAFIQSFVREKGYGPSVRDIQHGCQISSTSVVAYHLNKLHDNGVIHRDKIASRAMDLSGYLLNRIPLLGTIAAGEPIPLPDSDTWQPNVAWDMVEIPTNLINKEEGIYALKVKGTSMIDALIDDGDTVIMKHTKVAEDGDMVAVLLKDRSEVTLKRIFREHDRIRLQPANPLMEPIYVKPDDIEVQGRVVGVIRKI